MVGKCEHKSKKVLEKKVVNVEEVPCAYAATVTTTTYQMPMWKMGFPLNLRVLASPPFPPVVDSVP
jgi:hypothetical protein